MLSYIHNQSIGKERKDRVHIVWFFVGTRWEPFDKESVDDLLELNVQVVAIINKSCSDVRNHRDPTTHKSGKEMLEKAILEQWPGLHVILCSDCSKQLGGWKPVSYSRGHSSQYFSCNERRQTWKCEHSTDGVNESGESISENYCRKEGDGDGAVHCIGYKRLAELSLELLPDAVREAFSYAQKKDVTEKINAAVAIILCHVAYMMSTAAIPL